MSILKTPLLVLNILAVIALLLVYISAYIHPAKSVLPSLAGLTYPIILAINFSFALLWIIARKKVALLSIVFIILGWNHLGGMIQFNGTKEIPVENKAFKLLSFNVQNFYHVNISSTKYIKDFDNRNRIVDFLEEENADIVCLQEILHDKGNNTDFIKKLGATLNCPNSYYKNYFQKNTREVEAIITYTKFPIISSGNIVYENKTFALFHDLKIAGDTVRLYNLHLASIHFQRDEYDFISEMGGGKDNEEFRESSRKIISKLSLAFQKRGNQADIVSKHIRNSPYPVIICGDFNDTHTSYAYHKVAQNLKDAFKESGSGFAKTYGGKNFPSLRIDHILHEKKFQAINFKRHKIKLSDHYPVSCFLMKK